VDSNPNRTTALDTHFSEPCGRLRWIAWRKTGDGMSPVLALEELS